MTSIVAKVASKNKRHKKRRVDDTFYPTHLPRARCTCFVSLTLTEVFGGGLKIDPAKRHLKAIQIHSRMKAAKKTPRITLIFVSKPSKARKLWLTAPLSTSHYISKKDCLGFDPLSKGVALQPLVTSVLLQCTYYNARCEIRSMRFLPHPPREIK